MAFELHRLADTLPPGGAPHLPEDGIGRVADLVHGSVQAAGADDTARMPRRDRADAVPAA